MCIVHVDSWNMNWGEWNSLGMGGYRVSRTRCEAKASASTRLNKARQETQDKRHNKGS